MINQALLGVVSVVVSYISPSVQVIQHPIAITAYASQMAPIEATQPMVESIETKIARIALSYKISPETLTNLVMSESTLNPKIVDGDMFIVCPSGVNKGQPVRARGLLQITTCYHPEVTDEQAYDPDFAITYGAKEIANDTAWREHTACNCYSYMKTLVPHLPAMKDIKPNVSQPVVGAIILFDYHGTPHEGYVTKITSTANGQTYHIKEANKITCKITERDVSSHDKFIIGFWVSP